MAEIKSLPAEIAGRLVTRWNGSQLSGARVEFCCADRTLPKLIRAECPALHLGECDFGNAKSNQEGLGWCRGSIPDHDLVEEFFDVSLREDYFFAAIQSGLQSCN